MNIESISEGTIVKYKGFSEILNFLSYSVKVIEGKSHHSAHPS